MISLTNSDGSDFDAYIAQPSGAPKGALIVIHEIWGLVDHIKSIADRFAAEGYLVLAPDLLSHAGIRPDIGLELNAIMTSTDEKVRVDGQPRLREAFSIMRAPDFAAWAVDALTRCVDYLEPQPGIDGHIGVLGFCFGGTYSFALAAADSRVRVAVPFYGAPPELAAVPNIRASVLALYGRHDPSLMESLPDVQNAMVGASIDFDLHIYEQAGHAFFNDTSPNAYNAEAAADAWGRANEFLRAKI